MQFLKGITSRVGSRARRSSSDATGGWYRIGPLRNRYHRRWQRRQVSRQATATTITSAVPRLGRPHWRLPPCWTSAPYLSLRRWTVSCSWTDASSRWRARISSMAPRSGSTTARTSKHVTPFVTISPETDPSAGSGRVIAIAAPLHTESWCQVQRHPHGRIGASPDCISLSSLSPHPHKPVSVESIHLPIPRLFRPPRIRAQSSLTATVPF